MQAAEPIRHRFTITEVMRMEAAGVLDAGRYELIDGELIEMPPQGPSHAGVGVELTRRLVLTYPRHLVRPAMPLEVGDPVTLPEPDFAVVRGEAREFRGRHPRGDEAVLVVEIAQTSLTHDRRKRVWYARSGVTEYWIVDLHGSAIEVYTDPDRAEGVYRTERRVGLAGTVTPPETALEWSVSELILG